MKDLTFKLDNANVARMERKRRALFYTESITITCYPFG